MYEDVKDLVPPPDFRLNIMKENQSLTDILSYISSGLSELLISETPNLLIIQGDTSTVAICALIAFILIKTSLICQDVILLVY